MKSQAVCGWIMCLALLKLYVNLQVTRLLNKKPGWCSSVFIMVLRWHFLMSLSWNLSYLLASIWKEKTKRSWPACDFFKCGAQQLASVFLFAESLCYTPFLLVSDSLSHCNPHANKNDYECSPDPLNSPSPLDWVWQAEEGMDIMDSTNFNETNLSYGLTFGNSPCEWQCQQSTLWKLSREGPCNDGGS